MEPKFDWTDDNMPVILRNKSEVPFYFTSKSDDTMSISLNKMTKNKLSTNDVCINITYDVTNSSDILVTYNDNKPLLPLTKVTEDGWQRQTLCLSYLTRTIAKDSRIYIKAVQKNSSRSDTLAVRLDVSEVNPKPVLNTTSYITHWNESDFKYNFSNLWPIAVPDGHWILTGDEKDELEFHGNFNSISIQM